MPAYYGNSSGYATGYGQQGTGYAGYHTPGASSHSAASGYYGGHGSSYGASGFGGSSFAGHVPGAGAKFQGYGNAGTLPFSCVVDVINLDGLELLVKLCGMRSASRVLEIY